MSKLTILVVIVLAAVAAQKVGERSKAMITLRIVDEAGKPISGANVDLGFQSPNPTWGSSAGSKKISGLTGSAGTFSGEGHCDGTLGGQAHKEGYYYGFAKTFQFSTHSLGKWEPWNPTVDLILKKINRPVPMYAKKVNVGIPQMGSALGFDLVAGDWVRPHGKGASSDLLITAILDQREAEYDYKLTIGFPNKGDGIKAFERSSYSELKSAQVAPIDGYDPEWVQTRSVKQGRPEVTNRDENRSYYFRVRTIMNEGGQIESANYGKIYGDFMNFTYYCNPTPNDRGMEFDRKRNLLRNESTADEVTDP
jgi:hypothetical protein